MPEVSNGSPATALAPAPVSVDPSEPPSTVPSTPVASGAPLAQPELSSFLYKWTNYLKVSVKYLSQISWILFNY